MQIKREKKDVIVFHQTVEKPIYLAFHKKCKRQCFSVQDRIRQLIVQDIETDKIQP